MAAWNQFISASDRPVTRLQLLAKSAEISNKLSRFLFPISLPPYDIELFASLVEKKSTARSKFESWKCVIARNNKRDILTDGIGWHSSHRIFVHKYFNKVIK